MALIVTSPDGNQLRIDGTRICTMSSPEECWEEDPYWINGLINYAWHHRGWSVKREESLAELFKREE